MKVEVKELEGLKREVSVIVPPETVKAEMDKGFEAVRREVTLKGYRKGKAPMASIRSLYADKVRADAIDALVRSTFPDIASDKGLNIASPPTLTKIDFDKDGSFNYSAEIEVFPEIDKVILDNLEIPTVEIDVSDEEADKAMDHLRRQLSEIRAVDRAAKADDIILADMKKIADPKMAIENQHFPDAEVDLASESTVKEFREHLPGLAAGDEKEIEVKYAEDNPNPKLAGAAVTYLCKVKEVRERILPELSDAFAKSTGRAETALELKLLIREDILAHKNQELKRLQKRQLVGKVCENNQIPIPDGMVNNYLDAVVEDIKKQNADVNEEEIRKQYRPSGVNSMRWEMLWHKVADEEKIEVLPADTEKWIETFSKANSMTEKQAGQFLRESGRIDSLRESIREDKVLEFLISQARKVPLKTG